ncbi:hypothetical protein J1N35_019053 [Gossypium stocksii]|uniref:Uncharacterized protein n=1 Tax=Gossypium stocksii TaxID=47602 RepID=A0A9D4A7R7_9ROSI|nr:hypothetical protein J1N35_019053 [Gossypium stocksii]
MHIEPKKENNISALSKGINSLVDITSVYFNKLYNKVNNIESKVENMSKVTELELNNESKELLLDINNKLDNVLTNKNEEQEMDLGPLYYGNSNVILALSEEDQTSSDESDTNNNIKKEKQKGEYSKQQKYDFQCYKELIEHWKEKFSTTEDQYERVEYLKLIKELYEKHKDLFKIFNYHYMLNNDITDSSSSSNDDTKSEDNNSIISEEINANSYNSDEENTSTEENIEIPKPIDTDNTDPYIPKPKENDKKDPYGKRKIESDIQKDDYLRSFNKDNEQVEETTRIFETIATNDVKP